MFASHSHRIIACAIRRASSAKCFPAHYSASKWFKGSEIITYFNFQNGFHCNRLSINKHIQTELCETDWLWVTFQLETDARGARVLSGSISNGLATSEVSPWADCSFSLLLLYSVGLTFPWDPPGSIQERCLTCRTYSGLYLFHRHLRPCHWLVSALTEWEPKSTGHGWLWSNVPDVAESLCGVRACEKTSCPGSRWTADWWAGDQ